MAATAKSTLGEATYNGGNLPGAGDCIRCATGMKTKVGKARVTDETLGNGLIYREIRQSYRCSNCGARWNTLQSIVI